MNIGFVGLGLMGAPMANRILGGGHKLFVYNRSKEKAMTFMERGAVWCDSPSDLASQSDLVISMVSTPDVLAGIALGPNGILQGMTKDSVHADCSTVSPALTSRLEKEYRARHRYFLHSPVLGSVPNATDGTLLLFIGGDAQAFSKGEPVFRLFGSKIWRFERAEQATHTKLLCNFFISSMISTLAQGLAYAEKTNIDPRTFLEILGNSALNAPTYQSKGASMVAGNFAPRFFLEHMFKDINIVLDSARESGASLPGAEMARTLYASALEAGLAKEDYSAVIKVLRDHNL